MQMLTVFLLSLFPLLGHAEVVDKECSLVTIWLLGLSESVLSFLAARFKPWLLFIVLPMIGVSELMDPHVGLAMAEEAGRFYMFISWAAPILLLAGTGLGFMLR